MQAQESTQPGDKKGSICPVDLLMKALSLRRKYIRVSLQDTCALPGSSFPEPLSAEKKDGCFRIPNDAADIPSASEYFADLEYMSKIIHNGPLKTFCFQRLEHLELQFRLHRNSAAAVERMEQKTTSYKDFYTVVKVDTHIHHSASMNSKKLLQFIKKKLRETPQDVVHEGMKGPYTLEEVFKQLNKTSDSLCLDSLDTHSNIDTFHRFDRFNFKYNPYGLPLLREIFLKHDNYIGGRYLAEITKELIEEVEEKEYLKCEWGVSVYGKKRNELLVLSEWCRRYSIQSSSIRWYLQIPRLYSVFREFGNIESFAEFLSNIFSPLVESSVSDARDSVSVFLESVVGIDSVDDEGLKDRRTKLEKESPELWTRKENPPYHYYIYHMYYNISVINRIRASRKKNLFALRPHAGEAGDVDHLICAFLTSRSIAHGVKLRKSPVLQYLYYLAQIGISMSPLSNNSLFIEYRKNPFPLFFYRGLNVSLSTDDPLQFHYTREPLMEEYSIASQIWNLSSCDQCEIARNSILQSNFPSHLKKEWIGDYHRSPKEHQMRNDPRKTNVPPTRFLYREKMLSNEHQLLMEHRRQAHPASESASGTSPHTSHGFAPHHTSSGSAE